MKNRGVYKSGGIRNRIFNQSKIDSLYVGTDNRRLSVFKVPKYETGKGTTWGVLPVFRSLTGRYIRYKVHRVWVFKRRVYLYRVIVWILRKKGPGGGFPSGTDIRTYRDWISSPFTTKKRTLFSTPSRNWTPHQTSLYKYTLGRPPLTSTHNDTRSGRWV